MRCMCKGSTLAGEKLGAHPLASDAARATKTNVMRENKLSELDDDMAQRRQHAAMRMAHVE